MKKWMKTAISLLLVAVVLIVQPLNAMAAGTETYISELVIETGKTAAEAKSRLTEAGYTVFDKNISNAASGDGREGYMYIGYKTTKNSEEAITDIRMMNMGGGYSYAEYEELIDEKIDQIGIKVDELMIAVQEYRENYKAGKKSAVFAYEMLNKLVEDDSGLLMGEYMLDETKTRADYIDLLMQCSTVVYLTLYKALAVACAGTKEQSVFDLAEIDNADLEGEIQYEKTASDIYASLTLAQTLLSPYAYSGLTTADGATPEEIDAEYEELTDEEKATWNESFGFAYILESISLADGSTLYDLVMTDLDELTTEDLYAFASVLSDGQAALIRTAGLKDTISMAVLDEDEWAEMGQYLLELEEPISVYLGVDRSLFEGGVALTNKAMVEAAANAEKDWFDTSLDDETAVKFYKTIGISLLVAAGATALYLVSNGMYNWIGSSISSMVLTKDYVVSINLGGEWAAEWLAERALMETTQTVMLYISQILTYITWTAIGIALIATAIFLIADGYAYYHPTYDEIPRILVEKTTDADDETVYLNYYSVKNLSGEIVDINQREASRWVTLYTTKDPQAGNPVLTELAFSDKNLKEGFNGLCRFSEESAFNLNKYSFNYGNRISRGEENELISPLYIFFKNSRHSVGFENNLGSVFAPNNIIFGLGGLLIGALGGFYGCKAANQKKRMKQEAI